jgi:hypothetical protein
MNIRFESAADSLARFPRTAALERIADVENYRKALVSRAANGQEQLLDSIQGASRRLLESLSDTAHEIDHHQHSNSHNDKGDCYEPSQYLWIENNEYAQGDKQDSGNHHPQTMPLQVSAIGHIGICVVSTMTSSMCRSR